MSSDENMYFKLKYVEGSLPGKKPQKRKAEADKLLEKKEKSKRYEAERQRSFKDTWKIGREWLLFDSTEGVMKCQVCISHLKKVRSGKIFLGLVKLVHLPDRLSYKNYRLSHRLYYR